MHEKIVLNGGDGIAADDKEEAFNQLFKLTNEKFNIFQ